MWSSLQGLHLITQQKDQAEEDGGKWLQRATRRGRTTQVSDVLLTICHPQQEKWTPHVCVSRCGVICALEPLGYSCSVLYSTSRSWERSNQATVHTNVKKKKGKDEDEDDDVSFKKKNQALIMISVAVGLLVLLIVITVPSVLLTQSGKKPHGKKYLCGKRPKQTKSCY